MSKKRKTTQARHPQGGGAHGKDPHGHDPEHGQAESHEPGHEHDDDLIVVPKGESRTAFYLKLGLVMFLLIIFVVPGALMSSLTSGSPNAGEVFLAWVGPDGTRHELDYTGFVQKKREMLWLDETNPGFQQFRGFGNLAILGLGDFDPKEEFDTARFLILEDLARHEGIRATVGDLNEAILTLFGSPDTYHAVMQARRSYLSASDFEAILSRALIVRRFLGYVAAGAATADPQEVVRRWQQDHQEYAFDYVEVATADFADATRAELPADEELEAWFDALPLNRRSKHNTPPRWSAEFAWIPIGEGAEGTYEELLAQYPRPADSDPEELAQQYYNNQKFYRFRRPEPLTEEEQPVADLRNFYSFEEVADAARREAPLYYAAQDWHGDLVSRIAAVEAEKAADAGSTDEDAEAGEGMAEEPPEEGSGEDSPEDAPEEPEGPPAVDFAAEAAELGLERSGVSESRDNPGWIEAELPWGAEPGSRIVGRMQGVAEGRVTPSVFVDEEAIVVARVVEKVPPGLPPFAEIRDAVADDWVAEHQAENALASLEELRDLLGERPEPPEDETQPAETFEPTATQEEFTQAAVELGLEVRRRDYAERQDPGLDEGQAPIETLLRFNPLFFSIEEGEVPEARTDFNREHAFVVRFAGQRDPDVSKMEPADLEALRSKLQGAAVERFMADTFGSPDYLAETFQMRLRDPRAEAKKREEEPAPSN